MKRSIKYVSIFILIIITFVGVIACIFCNQIKDHFVPVVEQIDNIYIKVEKDTCYINSKLTVTNKSFFKIGIDTIKYKVSLFDKIYLQSKKNIGINLFGHAKDTVDFSLKIPYKRIIKDLKEERKRGDSANYSVNVFLQYSTFLGKGEMPINKSAKLKIPQPPELEIVEIKYKKIRMKFILADVKIKIINYNNVNLAIKQMNYSMNILKQGNMKGKHIEQINIKSNGVTFINFPIEISPKNLTRTVFDVLINKDAYDYTLTMNAILESPDYLKESFHIDLTKNGKMELKK